MATLKRLPLTSTSSSRLILGSSSSSLGAGRGHLGEIRASSTRWSSTRCGNRRARGWRCRPGSWWQRLRPQLAECSGAVDGDLPRAAPDDELADEIVVEQADLVAGFVAGVPANAEIIGWGERRDRAGGREDATGRICVDTDLDGVTADLDLVLGERQRLTGGGASCCSTRSTPVMSSVAGCST